MTILTAGGSFAEAYTHQFEANIASFRNLGEEDFIEALRYAKVIIHNAATLQADGLDDYIERNFDFTHYVVRTLQAINPKAHLIFLSSMSILNPYDDQSYGDVLAMSPYAYSKYLSETLCLKSKLVNVSCVRFSTLFYQNPQKDGLSDLVSEAVRKKRITIYNGGEARRNFLPLVVAASYVHKLSDMKATGKHTYNLAAAASLSFSDIVCLLKRHIPELVVNDKTVPASPPVLADFSAEDINMIGRIDFSLEDHITTYIKKLQT